MIRELILTVTENNKTLYTVQAKIFPQCSQEKRKY